MRRQQWIAAAAGTPHNLVMAGDSLVYGNSPFVRMFEYNAWANGRIIDACCDLGDPQLDYGQYSFLARLSGSAQDARAYSTPWSGFDALTLVAAETSDALIDAAGALDGDADVALAFQGKNHRYKKSFFLLHAIQHGIEHRTQIGMMLAQLGLEPPNLDGWEFAAFAGLGTEV